MSIAGPMPFKMFGLHRSGTNLMVALMQRNFDVQSLEAGAEWKHGPVENPDRLWNGIPARFILCIRSPYAWAHSCYNYFRRACGADMTVARQFQRDPSVTFEEFLLTPSYEFDSPIDRWNRMNRSWLNSLPPSRTAIVRQELQLIDQLKVLEDVEAKLQLRRKTDKLLQIDQRVDVNASVGGTYRRDYFLGRQYMAAYSPLLLDHVNAALDWSLMDRFGFQRERWCLAVKELHGVTISVRPRTSDAAEAREVLRDLYGFARIHDSAGEVRTFVDLGAHIGSATLLARKLWPTCSVIAYEPCAENYRMLQINCGSMPDANLVCAAVTEQSEEKVFFSQALPQQDGVDVTGNRSVGSGFDLVPAVSLDRLVQELGVIDLLKIGCPDSTISILKCAAATGLLRKIRWICGRLPTQNSSASLAAMVAETHSTETHRSSEDTIFTCTPCNN